METITGYLKDGRKLSQPCAPHKGKGGGGADLKSWWELVGILFGLVSDQKGVYILNSFFGPACSGSKLIYENCFQWILECWDYWDNFLFLLSDSSPNSLSCRGSDGLVRGFRLASQIRWCRCHRRAPVAGVRRQLPTQVRVKSDMS